MKTTNHNSNMILTTQFYLENEKWLKYVEDNLVLFIKHPELTKEQKEKLLKLNDIYKTNYGDNLFIISND